MSTERDTTRRWNSQNGRWEYPLSDEQLMSVKQAFFATFVASGERWFPYGEDIGINDKLAPVDGVWEDFMSHLEPDDES